MTDCCLSTCDQGIQKVHPGEDKDITVYLITSENERPFDLDAFDTGAGDTVTYRFAKTDDSIMERVLSNTLSQVEFISKPGGIVNCPLSPTETLQLKVSDKQDYEVVVFFGGKTYIAGIEQKLYVKPRIDS